MHHYRRLKLVIGGYFLLFSALPLAQRGGAPVSSSWRRIRAADVILVGNASERELQRNLEKIQAFRHAMNTLVSGLKESSGIPMTVVVFKDFDAFARFQPRDANGKRQNAAGYTMFNADANFIVFGARDDGYPVIFHEYAHYLIHLNTTGALPTWLDEGLAEFYATFEAEYKGRSLLGRPPAVRMTWLAKGTYLPLREIVSPRNMEEMWRSSERISMFYAEAWALVHYVTVQRKSPVAAPFAEYLKAIGENASQDQAFVRAFGVNVNEMDEELRVYLRRLTFGAFYLPAPPRAATEERVEMMSEADVRALHGRLFTVVGVASDAERELQSAIKLEPDHVDARVSLAALRLHQTRADEAAATLQDVMRSEPDNVRARYFLGRALLTEGKPDAAFEAFSAGLRINERHAGMWLGLGESALAVRRDAQARAAITQAARLQGSASPYRVFAEAALRLGRNDIAAESAHSYVERTGVSESAGQYGAFLEAVAARRAGQPDRADAALRLVAPAISDQTWAASVLRFLSRQLDAAKFLASAKSIGEQTEAHTYIGFDLVEQGRIDEALQHLQWVVDHGAPNYAEYGMARAEMARLRQKG